MFSILSRLFPTRTLRNCCEMSSIFVVIFLVTGGVTHPFGGFIAERVGRQVSQPILSLGATLGWLALGGRRYSPNMMRWMAEARPVSGSQVTSAAHILGFPFAASNLPGIAVKNLCSTSSVSTPMMLS